MINGSIVNCKTGKIPTPIIGIKGIESAYNQSPLEICHISPMIAPIAPTSNKIATLPVLKFLIQKISL